MSDADAKLVERCLANEPGAFGELYAAHAGRVMAYMLRRGFAASDAEDLTQDAFLRAARSLGSFDASRGSLGQWLAAIARNICRRNWQRYADGHNFDPLLCEEIFALSDGPDKAAGNAEELAALEDCISRLPQELATLVRLRYICGMTTRGLVGASGLPESTVRQRLTEAREKLSAALKEKGFLK
ncbi:MAG: sigma-70 family RNA polymerase sigma factor [Planctomycetes bacterium]|nr:sigma-70 family RNA polymerase sigma factor [Planctomycetota bacterium]